MSHIVVRIFGGKRVALLYCPVQLAFILILFNWFEVEFVSFRLSIKNPLSDEVPEILVMDRLITEMFFKVPRDIPE